MQNTAYARWLNDDPRLSLTGPEDWSEACLTAFRALRDTRVQSFQYKLLNRITPCGAYLKQIRIRETDECPICGGTDTLIHLFLALWLQVQRWAHGVEDLHLERLTPKELLMGVPRSRPKSKIINNIVLLVKYYIHRQKLFYDGDLSLIQWLGELKMRLNTKKWICGRLGKPINFLPWRKYLTALGC